MGILAMVYDLEMNRSQIRTKMAFVGNFSAILELLSGLISPRRIPGDSPSIHSCLIYESKMLFETLPTLPRFSNGG